MPYDLQWKKRSSDNWISSTVSDAKMEAILGLIFPNIVTGDFPPSDAGNITLEKVQALYAQTVYGFDAPSPDLVGDMSVFPLTSLESSLTAPNGKATPIQWKEVSLDAIGTMLGLVDNKSLAFDIKVDASEWKARKNIPPVGLEFVEFDSLQDRSW